MIIVMRREYLTYVNEYRGRLEPFMTLLEEQGYWERLQQKEVSAYSFGVKPGLVFVFKVKSHGFPNYDNVVLQDNAL